MLEEGSVWRGLQEVHDGADPADVYARLTNESCDIEEAIENQIHDELEEAHDFEECREKVLTTSICHGFTCQTITMAQVGPVRMMLDCPCICHQGEQEL